ncbi:hypothetical protein CAOG_03206 [Capsaspora owczarzaki ATCC 30864]|uniref:BTB domain-containing protein n=1 Tax=Capsaspora owczarzaki (strain ATCC 30864) TaxID=595528 RepID=A0A0D2WNX0_CAPO3|nr:hypothetical protein CAOG_03206 [Capsaspora owczarzaki ATCC 30864]KJE92193.1 hypothetical protein CAOG_003206 [Capsaspora owczarzaki ATCC 30864]|eukprot:XP_004364045.2 hypothetical protein CAOG_03206 [Capsaspora owczarzaki ATCC 30864]
MLRSLSIEPFERQSCPVEQLEVQVEAILPTTAPATVDRTIPIMMTTTTTTMNDSDDDEDEDDQSDEDEFDDIEGNDNLDTNHSTANAANSADAAAGSSNQAAGSNDGQSMLEISSASLLLLEGSILTFEADGDLRIVVPPESRDALRPLKLHRFVNYECNKDDSLLTLLSSDQRAMVFEVQQGDQVLLLDTVRMHWVLVREPGRQHSTFSLERALKDASFCDISFQASDGVVLQAHSAILQLRCPELVGMMKDPAKDSIRLATFDAGVLRALLFFLYTDTAPPELVKVARPLSQLAKALHLRRLEAQCVQLFTDDAVLAEVMTYTHGIEAILQQILVTARRPEVSLDRPEIVLGVAKQHGADLCVAGLLFIRGADVLGRRRASLSREQQKVLYTNLQEWALRCMAILNRINLEVGHKLATALRQQNVSSVALPTSLQPYVVQALQSISSFAKDLGVGLRTLASVIKQSEAQNRKRKHAEASSAAGRSERSGVLRSMSVFAKYRSYAKLKSAFKSLRKYLKAIPKVCDKVLKADPSKQRERITGALLYMRDSVLQDDEEEFTRNLERSLRGSRLKKLISATTQGVSMGLNQFIEHPEAVQPLIKRLRDQVQSKEFDMQLVALNLLSASEVDSMDALAASTSADSTGRMVEEELVDDVGISFLSSMQQLYTERDATGDMSFVLSDGSAVPAHRVVVASASEWIHAALTNGMQEALNRQISMPDIPPESFMLFLNYLYTGDLDLSTSETAAVDLLELAERLAMPLVRETCTQYLLKSIDEDNAIALVTVADRFSIPKLQAAAMDFIVSHGDVIMQEDIQELDPHCAAELQRRVVQHQQHLEAALQRQKERDEQIKQAELLGNLVVPSFGTEPPELEFPEETISVDDGVAVSSLVAEMQAIVGEDVPAARLEHHLRAANFDVNRAVNFFFSE